MKKTIQIKQVYDTETDAVFRTKTGLIIRSGEEVLYLDDNQITKIENLNEKLERLYLDDNQITKIENLNEKLEWLYLSDNQITKIENLNENLERLYLSDNQITKIENLNEKLERLYLDDNPVTEITKEALDLIKKNKIGVYGVDLDKLKVVK